MFIAVLFTTANVWKQPKCPSTDEWIKMWGIYIYIHTHRYTHTHTIEYHAAIKNENIAICNNMDELGSYYAKWNKSETDKYCMISLICGIQKI